MEDVAFSPSKHFCFQWLILLLTVWVLGKYSQAHPQRKDTWVANSASSPTPKSMTNRIRVLATAKLRITAMHLYAKKGRLANSCQISTALSGGLQS